MEAVIIPAKTLVHIGGVPVLLATDTIVETAHENMAQLTGYHYSHLLGEPLSSVEPAETTDVDISTSDVRVGQQ